MKIRFARLLGAHYPNGLGRRLRLGLALVAACGLAVFTRGAAARAAPATPIWPAPELVDGVRDMLVGFYGQRAAAGDPYYRRAPEWDADRAASSKDPDSLWEIHGGPGTVCHPAATDAAFIDCTGKRLARSLGRPYFGGLTLFDPGRDYYANEGMIHLAAYYALYHAFVHDFDAATDSPYTPSTDPAIRDNKAYHRAMTRAYTRHMTNALLRMIRDTRGDYIMQADLTRSVGGLIVSYVRTLQAMQQMDAWGSPSERSDSLALLAGLVQRAYWEWMEPQPSGPRTAGFAPFGSEEQYAARVGSDASYLGTDQFVFGGQAVPSLRPDYMNTGPYGGLWFDADYALPGDWYCHSRFAPSSPEKQTCLALAAQVGKGGTRSPFGQYYGATGCGDRAPLGAVTIHNCGATNLGSIAEEWTWTHVGARLGAWLLRSLPALPPSDPNARPRAIGALTYDKITARLGYGVSGWHGGAGPHDDMEWALNPEGITGPIRTLSAGRHDGQAQDGLMSLGETDVSPASSAIVGDTWLLDRQEMAGAMENHLPGPNSLYASLLFAYVLADQPSSGLSPSLFDTTYRNNVDEFGSWIWLALSSFNRCPNVPVADDPADGSCLAIDAAHYPYPATINRTALASSATGPEPASLRYLWKDVPGALTNRVAPARTTCRGEAGIPWRRLYDRDTSGQSEFLLDEGGFGAFNEQIQAYGGLMRLIAARYPLNAPDVADQPAFDVYRSDVLAPYYAQAYDQVAGILDLYGSDLGYVPDIENSSCVGTDPEPGSTERTVHTWQYGTWDSASATTVRRALWYSVAALWYWQYDTNWLDIDPAEW